MLVAVPGFAFPFLPRHLTMAAFLTIGIPSFVLALAPSDGPLYRGRLIRALAAFAVPAGVATGIASIISCLLVNTVGGGNLAAGRTAATTTLIVLGLAFVLLLERGPGREGNAIQSYMLSMVIGLGALYALMLAAEPVRNFFELKILSAAQWFLALLSAAIGLTIAGLVWRLPVIERWEAEIDEPDEPQPDGGVRAPDAGVVGPRCVRLWFGIRALRTNALSPSHPQTLHASSRDRDFRLWAMPAG